MKSKLLIYKVFILFIVFGLLSNSGFTQTLKDTTQTEIRVDSTENESEIKKEVVKAEIEEPRPKQSPYDALKQGLKKSLKKTIDLQKIPVTLQKDTFFFLSNSMGPYTTEERAELLERRLKSLFILDDFDEDSLLLFQTENAYIIEYKGKLIMTILPQDAELINKSNEEAGLFYKDAIASHLKSLKSKFNLIDILLKVAMLLLVIVIFYFIFRFINKGYKWLETKINTDWKDNYIKGFKYKNIEFVTDHTALTVTQFIAKGIRLLIILLAFYISLPTIFSIFPSTEGIAKTLFGLILDPFKSIIFGFINYIPSAITIGVIVVVTRYLIRFLKFLSLQVEREELQLPGFYPDWAKPTFNIIRFLIYAFMFVIIFPYLPGSNSPVFQGVSVFLGLLISLGSTSAISNLVAGMVITYMRPFKIGDRVKIGPVEGEVLEKSMLVTRVKTILNEEITLPNASILSGHTINYSSFSKDDGVIINVAVTIGYDVKWEQTEQLLLNAAEKTDLVLKSPKPFVLKTSLDDFYISYQLNCYINTPEFTGKIKSDLNMHILNEFNLAGVEILSPHYRANRDGSDITIPNI